MRIKKYSEMAIEELMREFNRSNVLKKLNEKKCKPCAKKYSTQITFIKAEIVKRGFTI